MPQALTYPGIYIDEISSGVRTIIGVSTSTTAFVGRAKKGPVNKPVVIHNFGEFDRIFGGLWEESTLSFAVQQYFLNGGSEAVIVRVTRSDAPVAQIAVFTLKAGTEVLILEASSPGEWANTLKITVDHVTSDPANLFNLKIEDKAPPIGTGESETLRNLSIDPKSPSFVTKILEQKSKFLRVPATGKVPTVRSPEDGDYDKPTTQGKDGGDIQDKDVVPDSPKKGIGIYALDDADIFNLLCLPPLTFDTDFDPNYVYSRAATYCEKRRAMLLVDPPRDTLIVDPTEANNYLTKKLILPSKNAAIFFPRLRFANPLKNNLIEDFVPCGAVAGIFARIDYQRGVWKAPAGQEATLIGVSEMTYSLTDDENGDLNKLGINCLRTFPLVGPVVWGSRTLKGADALADEWKYIPVRRLALFIEESLYRSTQWIVFEPNDEPLWAQIRLNIGAFMHGLFRQGAFQGKTPQEAYLVKCDKETTTQDDINKGIVNIVVGFAPLKPAEFVVIKIQQMAGQIQV